jgi:hypothetical protein
MSSIVVVEKCGLCLVRSVYLTESEISMRRENPRLAPVCAACVESMRATAARLAGTRRIAPQTPPATARGTS